MKKTDNVEFKCYNGFTLKDVCHHRTLWGRVKHKATLFVRKCMLVSLGAIAITGLICGSAYAGNKFLPPTVQAVEVIKEVEVKGVPPILKKIAEAESLSSHYCTEKIAKLKITWGCNKNSIGSVLINETLDVGIYAINLPTWGKWCADRGYDIFKEQGNEGCAIEIFMEKGSEPWSASKVRWSK